MASRSSSSKRKTLGGYLLAALKWLFVAVALLGLAAVASVAGIFYYYGQDLPELMERDDYEPAEMSRVYSADGELLAEFHPPGERRTLVPLEEIPEDVQKAFLAAEDSEFMTHDGIDYLGMVRAVYFAVRYDEGMRGTSTITQQLVKNIVLTPERTYERKIQEIILARELEQNLSKEDILYMYLNTIYLGRGNHGVGEAARFYFGKSVDELDVEESALLAGMTAAPEGANPLRNPERAEERRNYVLYQMWQNDWINEGTYHEARESEIETTPLSETHPHLGEAPYFVDTVRRQIEEEFGRETLFEGGLRIHTTLDLDQQRAAERAAREGLRSYDERHQFFRPVNQLAPEEIDDFVDDRTADYGDTLEPTEVYEGVVTAVEPDDERVQLQVGGYTAELMLQPRTRILGVGSERRELQEVFERGDIVRVQPTGTVTEESASPAEVRFESSTEAAVVAIEPHSREVRALVGGYDFEHNEYNHATQAQRQTGSAFKTIVFAAALEQQLLTPASIYQDSPAVFQMADGSDWSPTNFDGQSLGRMRVREALASSRNQVAVRVLDDVGIDTAIDFSRRIGIESHLPQGHTMVLGTGEMPPLELTNTYATFAADGQVAPPRFLNRVESSRGDHQVYRTRSEPAVAPEVAYLTTSLLESTVSGYVDRDGNYSGGTGGRVARLEHAVAGKTGTTNDTRDAWFVGYTPQMVTGVWVGFSDNSSLGSSETGGRLAAPIFRDFQEAILDDVEERLEFEPPASGITTANIDPATGKLARGDGIEEYFLVGTVPTEHAPHEDATTGDMHLIEQFQH